MGFTEHYPFKICSEKKKPHILVIHTCYTGQYLGARCVWKEYAACQFPHTVKGSMTTCSPPSAKETELLIKTN